MATSRMEFDVSFGPAGTKPRDGDEPMRMLVLADLGGSRALPLAQRKALVVDLDKFESLFARLTPKLAIELDGQAIEMQFESMDDFHPDRLYARLPAFDTLRRLRTEFEDPLQFRRAAAAMGLAASSAPAASAAPDNAAAAADVERLLGRKPTAVPAVQHWIRDLIAPHIVPDVAHEQRALLAAADAGLGALMRQLLHHPRVQALEASWLGIERLVRGLELGESLLLYVLDVSCDEVQADLAAHRADLTASALHRLLSTGGSAPMEGRHWGLLVLDQDFGSSANDVQQLASLGALAARAGAPLLAAATLDIVGDGPELAHWAALRTSPMAAWIGLVLPRVLLRLPYGAATDRIASFAFEEMPAAREHRAYLWGSGALALALLAGRAFEQDGWSMDLDTQLDLAELPSHVYTEDGEKHQQACAEQLLSETAGLALLARGLMPFMSWRNRNAVRLLRWQSLADPPCALRGLGA